MVDLTQNSPIVKQSKNKKKHLVYSAFFLLLSIIAVFVGIFLIRNTGQSGLTKTTKEINSKALAFNKSLSTQRVEEELAIINNTKLSDEERFKSLSDIYFYFSFAYSTSHDPAIREFVNKTFAKFANENFPKIQSNDDSKRVFMIPCADPSCGQEIDPKIKEIINKIMNSNIDTNLKNRVKGNIEVAAYKLEEDKEDKLFGFGIAKRQLEQSGNPTASEAGNLLKIYVKEKYKADI